MKAIMVMYDSLNRHLLETCGCDWTQTPNFRRLAEKSVQFENNYVGSLPCMPARRELHTGRLSFFHRSWGPLESFDDSMPELLKKTVSTPIWSATISITGRTAGLPTTPATPSGRYPAARRATPGRRSWASTTTRNRSLTGGRSGWSVPPIGRP